MSAAKALKAAQAAGVCVDVAGGKLKLRADRKPPSDVLDLLARHKAEIVALLCPPKDDWESADWHDFFNEHAAIIEYDGRLPRPQAEACAFNCCVVEWLNRNPVRSPPGRCLACGGGESSSDPVLPFGVESTGHAWLHSRCWPDWQAGRKADAVAALVTMGITLKPTFQTNLGTTEAPDG
jgi:hypothetical protein